MKPARQARFHRDQTLYRDIGFLLVATGLILVQAFDQSLQDAVLYAPLIVGGAFGALLGAAYLLTGALHLLDRIVGRIGIGRAPRR